MTNSLARRAIVCAGIVSLSVSLVGQPAFAKKDHDSPKGTKTHHVDCAKSKSSIQKKVDKVKHGSPTTIVIDGTCTEEVTITKDDVTLKGDGTVDGTITIIGAQRVIIDGLNVNSVSVLDNARVAFKDATIESDGSTAVTAVRSAVVVMENTTAEATGDDACAVAIVDGSVLRMNGGNELTNDAPGYNCATLLVYRNSTARIRGSGNTITNKDPVTGDPDSGSAGGFALDIEVVSSLRIDGTDAATINGNVESFNLSTVDLRKVVVNGGVYADGLTTNVRLRGNDDKDVIINGNVFPGYDSAVSIRNAGEVIINGNIDCTNGENVIQNFNHFGDSSTDGYVKCSFFIP